MTTEPKSFSDSLRELANSIANELMPDELDVLHKAADELERLSALEAPKPQGRTVRVRIACAVEPDGSWFSFGTDNMPDPMSVAKVAAGQHGRAHWITADLPIPEPVEVQGRVEGNHTGDSNGT